MNKIALGSAQFGGAYGINNKRRIIPKKEIFAILNRAAASGVDIIDTAPVYGKSESLLGAYMKLSGQRFKIVSKLPQDTAGEARAACRGSVKKMNVDRLYGYLIHNFDSYRKDPDIWGELEKLKKDGYTEKIGFSLYFPGELETILKEGIRIDILQIPLSVFDRRFASYLSVLKRRKIEVHARSVFLQGLVFKDAAELGGYFNPAKNKLSRLHALSRSARVPVAALCFDYIADNKNVDKVIVGLDSIKNFEQILRAASYSKQVKGVWAELSRLRIDNDNILVPVKWPAREANRQ